MEITKKDIGIYIPSMGRAHKQFTLERIPKDYLDITSVVVPASEYKRYSVTIPNWKGAKVLSCPVSGIGKTRQWILENCGKKYILMFDDDMYFYHRKGSKDWHLATNEEIDTIEMLDRLFGYMIDDKFIHIGLATRTEASFYLCSYRTCTRVNNVHGFDVQRVLKTMRKIGVSFNDLPIMEDFNVTLSLLRAGYPNKVMLDYVWNQPGSNSDGGCSTYRTEDLQAKSARKLAKLHPKFVKVVTKKVVGKTSWEGMKERTDVRIYWHEAWKSSGMGDHSHWRIERKYKRLVGK